MKRYWLFIFIALLVACSRNTPDNGGDPATTAVPPTPTTATVTNNDGSGATTVSPAGTAVPMPTRPPLVIPTIDPNAPTFYVATDGNDESGNGSLSAPWSTITHALDSVSDGSVILVRPGLYTGRVRIRGQFANGVLVRSELPYQAQLRADETVMTIFEAQGITIEGFDIAHASAAAEPIVVQIQDTMGEEPGGAEYTSRITLRNNILHDSYNNDILKINNGVQQIFIIGNIFYNQGDSDEHIDINSVRDVVVEDNIFFNNFGASGRAITGESSSFIVVKDSNANDDGIVGVDGLTIRRNIFMHYEGSAGHNMILLGEDGNEYFEATNVLVENNLFLGDGTAVRAPLGTKGVHDVLFRHNTISGDMPGSAFVWRSNVEESNQPNDNIQLYNNIFNDPLGTMDNFATAPEGETASFTLAHNLYWNGGQDLPSNGEDMVQISDDSNPVAGDPRLNPAQNIPTPVWDATTATFGGGAADIRTAFTQIVQAYGVPQAGSAAIDSADPAQVSGEDILGHGRAGGADLGAYEVQGNEAVIVLPTVSAPTTTTTGGGGTTSGGANAPQPTLAVPINGGWVTFAVREGDGERIFRLPITPGATAEDITAVLDAAAPGEYSEWLNISNDGEWYLLSTDRFDDECRGWPCLVVTQDFVTYETVKSDGAAVHAEYSAIANGGDLIVYKTGGGTHGRDLWAISRTGSGWSAPIEITADSPFNEHQPASISADGQTAVFACGDDPYASNALCEVGTDGTAFTVRLETTDALLFHPSYTADNAIVFEGDWAGEQLWRLDVGATDPTLITSHVNDNSPCMLPSGLIVSLWLQRDGNSQGYHEVKLTSADGRQYAMLLTGQDIFDIGTGCGGG